MKQKTSNFKKDKGHNYFNLWLLFIIGYIIILFGIVFSSACPEDKTTWLLIDMGLFMLAYKFWIDRTR